MTPFSRFIDLFLYTSLLTACCATGLCMATERLINNTGPALINDLHLLVFGSTLLVYNTPRIIRKTYSRAVHRQNRPWYFVFFFIGLFLTAWALIRMPFQVTAASSILGVFAFAYFLPVLPFGAKKRIRDFGWLKIAVLAGVWTIATSVLPMLFWQKDPMLYPFELLIRLSFIFTLCIIFDIRDVNADEQDHIYTLPQKVGIVNSYRLIDVMLVLFALFSVLQYVRHPDMVRLVSALLTALVTRMVATYLRRRPSDRAYLALADGVMLFYALLVLFPL